MIRDWKKSDLRSLLPLGKKKQFFFRIAGGRGCEGGGRGNVGSDDSENDFHDNDDKKAQKKTKRPDQGGGDCANTAPKDVNKAQSRSWLTKCSPQVDLLKTTLDPRCMRKQRAVCQPWGSLFAMQCFKVPQKSNAVNTD